MSKRLPFTPSIHKQVCPHLPHSYYHSQSSFQCRGHGTSVSGFRIFDSSTRSELITSSSLTLSSKSAPDLNMDGLCLQTIPPQSIISAITSKSDSWPHRWNENNSHSRMLRETAEKWIVMCRLGLVACRLLLIAVFDLPGEEYCTQVTLLIH